MTCSDLDRPDRAGPAPEPVPAAPDPGPGRLRLILVLGALIAVGPLSIDMYLPALPRIAADLAATDTGVQLTLTGTLLGLGLGQLLVGPLSDAVGRRRPLIVGTAVHVLASLGCLVAPGIVTLDVARVLQGLGASAGAVLALAVIRDRYTDRAASALLSRLILVLSVSPILAPTLGSALLAVTGWRGVFLALAGLGLLITVLTAVALPETLPPARRAPLAVRATMGTYAGLLRDVPFVGLTLAAGLAMAGLFGFVSGASFVFQRQFGLSQAQFGVMFAASAAWLIAATQLNVRLMRRWEPGTVLVAATGPATLGAAGLLGAALTGVGGRAALVAGLWATLFFLGLILPNVPAVALSAHGEAAGTAAALLGGTQFAVGAAVSPLVGVLGNDATAMATVIAGGVGLATAALLLVARPWRLPPVEAGAAVAVAH